MNKIKYIVISSSKMSGCLQGGIILQYNFTRNDTKSKNKLNGLGMRISQISEVNKIYSVSYHFLFHKGGGGGVKDNTWGSLMYFTPFN